MKILICGIDGYIGWPLAIHLLSRGHTVAGFDSQLRRKNLRSIGGNSLTPILPYYDRSRLLMNTFDKAEAIGLLYMHKDYDGLVDVLTTLQPDCIVNLAEQPSAPWSMRSREECLRTLQNNTAGNFNLMYATKDWCPEAHIVKLGTMGEYGTPPCPIPEGFIPDGPMAGLPFPRQPGSWYHLTKVQESLALEMASRFWNLTTTDIMQGIVFGVDWPTKPDGEEWNTRFDYDQYFGTVLNRFVTQALLGEPMTIYGSGQQMRSFLPLSDSIECLTLAIENPPELGTYRVFNQWARLFRLMHLAHIVCMVVPDTKWISLDDPRVEAQHHMYNPACEGLRKLGYNPTWLLGDKLQELVTSLTPHIHRAKTEVLAPTTTWT